VFWLDCPPNVFVLQAQAWNAHCSGDPQSTWAVVGDSAACTADSISTTLDSLDAKVSSGPEVFYGVDHVHPLSRPAGPAVVLYGTVGSSATRQAHSAIAARLKDTPFVYVFRHASGTCQSVGCGTSRVPLVGWGAELALKNTEYKLFDDELLDSEDGTVSSDKIDSNGMLLVTTHSCTYPLDAYIPPHTQTHARMYLLC
jgi:thioredoxin family protein